MKDILETPSTSFHEHEIHRHILSWAEKWKLSCVKDRFGNMILSTGILRGGRSLKNELSRQEFIFSAHMDHPGFEVVSTSKGNRCRVKLLGGVHRGQFNDAKVRIWDISRHQWIRGKVTRHAGCGPTTEAAYRTSMRVPVKEFDVKTQRPVPVGSFGNFSQPGCRMSKTGVISTKAADNLVNCALGLIVLRDLKKQSPGRRFCLVLTRAEEVGFVGLYGLVKSGQLPRHVPWIVLEASQARHPVKVGAGVVIRVGDRSTSFHSVVDHWLQKAAQTSATRDKDFHYQRALLSGGTCEASVLSFCGFLVGGLALPLGNYHNVGKNGPAAEKIHIRDAQSMRSMLCELARVKKPTAMFADSFRRLSKSIAPDLKRLRPFEVHAY